MKQLLIALLLAAVALSLWWLQGLGQDRPAPERDLSEIAELDTAPGLAPSTPATQGIAFVGRVIDPLGEPVAGCETVLLRSLEHVLDDSSDQRPTTTRSGPDGRFAIPRSGPGPFVLILRHPRFPPSTARSDLRPSPDGAIELGDLELRSTLGCEVLVRRSDNGAPVEGARLTLEPELVAAELGDSSGRGTVTRSGRCDLGGSCVFYGVTPGSYRLRISAAGLASRELRHEQLEGGPAPRIEVRLDAGFALQGLILDAESVPVEGAEIALAQRPGCPLVSARSGAGGEFRLPGLAPGQGRLTVQSVRGPELELEVELPREAPLVIRLGPFASLSGQVIDAHSRRPIEGAEVWARPADGFVEVRGGRFVDSRARTDQEGNFLIVGLSPGRFVVGASSDEHTPARIGPVDTGSQAPAAVTIELQTAITLRGRLFRHDGQPMSRANIEVMDARHDGSDWSEFVSAALRSPTGRRSTTPRSQGYFATPIDALPGDSIRLRVTAPGHATLLSKPFEVPGGSADFQVGELRLQLGGLVRGKALDAAGRPLPWSTVCADPVPDPTFPGSRLGARVEANARGEFELGPLAPGPYDLFYFLPAHSDAATAADQHASTRTRVLVRNGEPSNQDLSPR